VGGVIIQQYADKSPVNANIHVDYTKKGGKRVWFSYPNKKTRWQQFTSIYGLFLMMYFVAAAALILFIMLSGLVYGLLTVIFYPVSSTPSTATPFHWWDVIRLIAMMSLYIFPPLIPSLWIAWKYDKYKTTFPKLQFAFNRLLSPVHRVRVRKLKSKVFEIPYFHNVNLTYEATRDFGKFLKKVDIIPAGLKVKKLVLKREKEIEIRRWKAVFTFSEIPKRGQLTVDFL